MSSLRDEVAADSRPGRQGCSVGAFLARQPIETDDDSPTRTDWDEVFADKGMTNPAIHRAMVKRGYTLGPKNIETHRNKRCSCVRVA